MRMEKVDIAECSFIYDVSQEANYTECYQSKVNNGKITLESCLLSLLYKPQWVKILYKLRNVLVKPFGLKATTGSNATPNVQKGDKFVFFNVLERNEREILLFANDKHLEAWFSIQYDVNQDCSVVTFATVFKYHNLMGRIYFIIIKPFHYLIIRDLLSRTCNLNKNRI